MKRTALLMGAMLFATTMAYAYYGDCGIGKKTDSGDWVQKKVEKLTEQMSLTKEQSGQVEAALKEKMEKKAAVHKESQAKMDKIGEEYSAKIDAILNEEQKKKHEELKKEKSEMKGEGFGPGRYHKHKMMDKMDKTDKPVEEKVGSEDQS